MWLEDAMEYNETEHKYEDISRILAEWYAEPLSWEDRNAIALVEFKDGSRAALLAWHDSTGWDCQSGLDLIPFDSWLREVRAINYADWGDGRKTEDVIESLRQQLELNGG